MRLLKKIQSSGSVLPVKDTGRKAPYGTLPYEVDGDLFFDCEEAHLHQHAHPLGGLGCHDNKLREEQQRAIGEWVATLGKRLFTGGGLSSTPAPVIIFEPRSNLQKLTDCWVYTPLLVQAAEACTPLVRLKCTAAWFVAGLRHAFDTWRKPFNPVLGETWQSTNESGCAAFLEQVSHHPPVASFAMNGPGFRMHGSAELQIQVCMKHRGFKQLLKGSRVIEFANGDVIEFVQMPAFVTKGVVGSNDLRGDVDSRAILRLRSTDGSHYMAYLLFGPQSGATSGFRARSDAVHGYIVQVDGLASPPGSARTDMDVGSLSACSDSGPLDQTESMARGSLGAAWPRKRHDAVSSAGSFQQESTSAFLPSVSSMGTFFGYCNSAAEDAAVPLDALGTFHGSWLSHLDFAAPAKSDAAERLWTLADVDMHAFETLPQEQLLPSDCTFREDMQLLARGDVKGAEAAKQRIEDKQRRERKLRARKRC